MARDTKTLSVRIAPHTFDKFNLYTKDHRVFTQAKIVESLIEYFMNQSEEQKHLLVMGVGSDYLDLIGEALQLNAWGEHASRGSFWPWVIETYNKLNEISAEAQKSDEEQKSVSGEESSIKLVGILSLRRIAWFNLGTAWIKVAMELRAKALAGLGHHLKDGALETDTTTPNESKPDDWKDLYDAAIDSLRVAIANHSLFNMSLKEPYPPVLYNQACTWSLIAQYITEQNANNDELKQLAEAERQKEEEKSKEADKQTSDVCLSPSNILEANNALRKANECLRSIKKNYKSGPEGMAFENAQWMFDFAEHDQDIAFFRKGKEDDFEKWLDRGKARISLLESYKRFRRELPKDIEEGIDLEFSDVQM